MRIDVHGGADILVAQVLLCDFDIDPLHQHILSNDILTERLPKRASIEKLMEAITARKAFLETIRKDRQENYQKYGDKFFFIRTYIYPIPEELDHMHEQCELIKNNAIIMVGSAGNGKTTLLCRLSELIINDKMPCLLVNSRDIEGNCYDYIPGSDS